MSQQGYPGAGAPPQYGYQPGYQQPYPAQPQVAIYEQSPQVVVVNGLQCPNCGKVMQQGGIPIWAIILCICFFPIGLLFLLCREPSRCYSCGFSQ
eukprot:EC715705.1.p1 GENE.EC715705.1~~EC715705.1.p1  ORF type:complete len:95 (+),score=12.26 EC715705.1:41-325(+)